MPRLTGVTIDASKQSVNEGDSFDFVVYFDGLTVGSNYNYTLTGVSMSDIGIPLTGTITVNADRKVLLPITVASNNVTNDSKSITMTIGSISKTVSIVNMNTVTIIPSSTTIQEGGTVSFDILYSVIQIS